MIRIIRTGATSVASELSTIATIAALNAPFSAANRGRNFLPDYRKDRLGPVRSSVSSLYFIMARASLGIVELDICRRSVHQYLVRTSSEHLTLHQKDDLSLINH